MARSRLSAKDRADILAGYLPHRVQVQGLLEGRTVSMKGTLEQIDYLHFDTPAELRVHLGGRGNDTKWAFATVDQVLPVLYTLADLPQLPPRPNEGFTTPLQILLSKMNFISRLDVGAGEAIGHVEVDAGGWKRSNEVLLTLLVHTTYTDPHSWEVSDGSDYGVSISCFGEIQWRNISADQASGDEKRRKYGDWQNLYGTWLLDAFDFLRELHVAVGEVATTERHTKPDTLESYEVYRYIRKELPEQEGGVDNG